MNPERFSVSTLHRFERNIFKDTFWETRAMHKYRLMVGYIQTYTFFSERAKDNR
jgi:hypothetical protein